MAVLPPTHRRTCVSVHIQSNSPDPNYVQSAEADISQPRAETKWTCLLLVDLATTG